jgi:hypothetical protein
MKAPSIREGSKENGTQVTRNRIYKGCLVCKPILLDLALPQDMASSRRSGNGISPLLGECSILA